MHVGGGLGHDAREQRAGVLGHPERVLGRARGGWAAVAREPGQVVEHAREPLGRGEGAVGQQEVAQRPAVESREQQRAVRVVGEGE
jgi:hypothetical protein